MTTSSPNSHTSLVPVCHVSPSWHSVPSLEGGERAGSAGLWRGEEAGSMGGFSASQEVWHASLWVRS